MAGTPPNRVTSDSPVRSKQTCSVSNPSIRLKQSQMSQPPAPLFAKSICGAVQAAGLE